MYMHLFILFIVKSVILLVYISSFFSHRKSKYITHWLYQVNAPVTALSGKVSNLCLDTQDVKPNFDIIKLLDITIFCKLNPFST